MARCQRSHRDNHIEEASVSNRDSIPGGLGYVSMKPSHLNKNKQSKIASRPVARHNHTPRDSELAVMREIFVHSRYCRLGRGIKAKRAVRRLAALNSHRIHMARCSQLAVWGYHWPGGLGSARILSSCLRNEKEHKEIYCLLSFYR